MGNSITALLMTVFALLAGSTVSFAASKLCIDKFGSKMEPIDLKVLVPPVRSKIKAEKLYIQKGKYVYDEKELSKKKGEAFCTVEFSGKSAFMSYESIWKKNAFQYSRARDFSGENNEPGVSISPRPTKDGKKWVAISYDCINITDYQQLKDALSPIIDSPCTDWGDLLPKNKPACVTPDK